MNNTTCPHANRTETRGEFNAKGLFYAKDGGAVVRVVCRDCGRFYGYRVADKNKRGRDAA